MPRPPSSTSAVGLVGRAMIAALCLFVAWEGQRRLRLGPVLACAVLLGLGWIALHMLTGVEPDQDLYFYAEDGTALLAGNYPSSEYPTGAVALFAAETWLGGVPPRELHAVTMLGFHVVTVVAIWSIGTRWSPWLAAFVAVWPLNAFHWEFRYDLAPTAFLIMGLALALRERWALAGVALGVGTALKWSPALALVVLAAWLVVRREGRTALALTSGFVLSLATLTLPFLVWQASTVLDAYELQADRGITGESVWFLPLGVLGLATPGENPSDDVGVTASLDALATLAQVVVVAVVLLATRVRDRRQAIVLAGLTPAAFLLANRVFSSQFLVLLVAVWAFTAALVVVSAREQLAVGVAIAGATFANALVHPYTVPVGWQLASAALFVLAVGLTAWLVKGATEPRVAAEPP